MRNRPALAAIALCLLVAALALVLADRFDTPAVGVVAVVAVVGAFAVREAWAWRGDGKTWVLLSGSLLAVVAVAFLANKVTG